jgi:hypothetical protein
MPSLEDKTSAPSPAPDTMNLPARMPRIPEAVIDRFPEMEDYQSALDKWWGIVVGTVADTNEESATVTNQNNTGLINLVVTVDGVTASVTELAEVVADGFGNLSGKYTLTVTAGDVVTGMNITSSTGPGTNISEVAFQADKFQIYSGTTKKVMFVADAINDVVRLADTLVVDAANGKVYIGTGTFDDPGTPWYVDDLGRMSLKDKFVWDGSTLSIDGSITSTSGTIGGFTIGSTTLTAGSGATFINLDSAGTIFLGVADGAHPDTYIAPGTLRLDGYSPNNFASLSGHSATLNLGTWSYAGSYNYAINLQLDGTNGDYDSYGGVMRLRTGVGTTRITLDGTDGSINCSWYEVGGIQVVRAQQAAIPDSGAGDENADRINDILAALRTHGLIAT